MRLDQPRVPPLGDDELSDEQRELLSRGNTGRMNIFRTLARHPDLYKSWMPFGTYLLTKSALPAREREILILRAGHLCKAGYEVHQHARIGKRAGLSDEDLARIAEGAEAAGLATFERTLVQAADELVRDHFLSDATYGALRERYDEKQLLEVIFTVGQYTLVSMALNSLGVQIER